jgi:hypothetical protein
MPALPIPQSARVLAGGTLQLGVFVMPDEGGGALEELVWEVFKQKNHAVVPCLDGYWECLGQKDQRTFKKSRIDLLLDGIQQKKGGQKPERGSLYEDELWEWGHSELAAIRTFLIHLAS